MKKRSLIALFAMMLVLILALSACTTVPSDNAPTAAPDGETNATDAPHADPTTDPSETHPPAKENVAKVILILGQSNAVGASSSVYLKNKVDADRYDLMRRDGYENVRIVYHAGEDAATNYRSKKIDTISSAKLFDKVKFGQSLTTPYFGLEIGIAEYLSTAHPDETYYLIKVARGGESLSPKFLEGGELFERAMTITEGSLSVLKREGMTPEIIAICWMQGENEGSVKSLAESYDKSLEKLVEALRRRLAEYAPWKGIPFIDGGISTYWPYYKELNRSKINFAERSGNNYFIDAIGLGITTDQEPPGQPDLAHLDAESMLKLGMEFGKYVDMAYDKVK